MFVGFFKWWYGDGLTARINEIGARLSRVSDFFSVGLLAATLFAPFRQLSVGRVNGPLGVHLRAFFDNLVSRVIGALVRLAMMVAALFASVGVLIYSFAVVMGWLVLPLLPVAGLLLALAGGGA